MSKVLDTALSIIDQHIRLKHSEIVKKIYAETGYCDQNYNKYLAVVSSGSLTLRDYIRKRKLYFAARDLIGNPEKSIFEIALEYGYADQSAFTRAVNKEYNRTPSELRREKSEIPDNREVLDGFIASSSRLDVIFDKMDSRKYMSSSDWHYFETFIHATNELGFDTSTCCLISELSEQLSIPFGYLLQKCFEMAIMCEQEDRNIPDEMDEFMMELEIEGEDELKELCQHYKCKWYELTFAQVKIYQLGINSEDELDKIWKHYNCQ